MYLDPRYASIFAKLTVLSTFPDLLEVYYVSDAAGSFWSLSVFSPRLPVLFCLCVYFVHRTLYTTNNLGHRQQYTSSTGMSLLSYMVELDIYPRQSRRDA